MSKAGPEAGGSLLRHYWSQVWRYFVTGLLVWVPLIITLWVSWLVVKNLGFGLEGLIRRAYRALNIEDYYFPGVGFAIVLVLFLSTGLLTRYLVGRKMIGYGERILQKIPLISRVYRAVQQIRDVFVTREGAVFQKVCLVEYPRAGMIAVAFVTASEQGLVQQVAGRELLAVFVPTTPNPTSGYLVYLPREEVVEIDISIEEAMKLIVSGGAYLPLKTAPRLPQTKKKE